MSFFPHSFQSFRSVSVADIAFHRRRQFRFNSRNSDFINNDDSSRSNVSNRNSNNNNNSSYYNNNSSYNASLPASGRSSIRTTFALQRSGSDNLQNHHYNNNNDDEKRRYEKRRPQNGSERHLSR